MKTELSKADLANFYESAPFEQSADAILAIGAVTCEVRRWKRVAVASIAAWATLCFVSLFLFFGDGSHSTDTAASPSSNHSILPVKNVAGDVRLVAVVTHTDACQLCQQIRDITARLRTQFKDHPVMFVKLDLSDDVERKQSKMVTELLGFELPGDYRGPSFFVLDSSGNVLEELEGISKQELIATNLRGHLVRR